MNTQVQMMIGSYSLGNGKPVDLESKVRELLEPRILIIDSGQEHVRRLRTVLRANGYSDVQIVDKPLFGLVQCCEYEPDVVLIDPLHSLQHGHDILRDLVDLTSNGYFQPIVVLTHDQSPHSRRHALLRGACDYMTKPFDDARLLRRVRQLVSMTAINRVNRRSGQGSAGTGSQQRAIYTSAMERALAAVGDVCVARELQETPQYENSADYSDGGAVIASHACRVSAISEQLAQGMGLGAEFVRDLTLGALLHDIGKVAVPDEILFKPRHLTADEYDLIKRHTTIGARALSPATSLQMQVAHSMAKWHHERWEGNGYPNQLRCEEIPLQARIVAIADAYDAMTSDRVYRRAMSTTVALAKIREQNNRQFDPMITEAMLDLFATSEE